MALTISATDTELQKPVNTIFEQTLLRNARVRCPYFVGTVPGEIQKQRGTATITWRRIENLAASTSALSEQTTTAAYMGNRSSAALSFTNYTATVSKYGNFVILNEEVDLFNFNSQTDKIMEVMGINAGTSLDQLQAAVAEGNLTAAYAAGAASAGAVASKITKDVIRSVVNVIDKNSGLTFTPMTNGSNLEGTTPILPAYWGLCHPDVAIDICDMAGFKSVETYGAQTQTMNGEFGMLTVAGKGVRFISTPDSGVTANGGANSAVANDLVTTGGTNVDLYHTCIWAQDAVASVGLGNQYPDGIYMAGDDLGPVEIIVKGLGSGGTSDPYNEISTIAWKAWHTGKIVNANWGRCIVSGATNIAS